MLIPHIRISSGYGFFYLTMNYNTHLNKIKDHFLETDLLKEEEFFIFKNNSCAKKLIDKCIHLSHQASIRLGINIYFAVAFNYQLNASVKFKNNQGAIIFNLGLIENLETLVPESIELFSNEIVANFTIDDNEKNYLERILNDCSILYLFNHELAHIIQLSKTKSTSIKYFQELYSNIKIFKLKNHIYEFDADYFGITISTIHMLEKILDNKLEHNQVRLYNHISAFLLVTANIIIQFSSESFIELYYKKKSHPHSLIRIIGIIEQVLHTSEQNIPINKSLFPVILDRTGNLISQIQYSKGRTLNYPKLIKENFEEIERYNKEIEIENENYKELTRFKLQDLINILIKP